MTASGAAPNAASGAAGSIYDLGYRGYDGPRLGRRHAIRALLTHSLKICYGIGRGGRAKLAPLILGGFAIIPAIVGVGVLALARQMGVPGGAVEDASPIQHSTYFGIIATLVMLFCAAQVPEVLGRDQRFNLLSLYFSRALRRVDYAVARLAGIVVAILVFVLFPQAIIFFGLVLSAPDVGAEFGREMAFVPPILGQGLLLSVVLASVSAAIASFTPRRLYATTAIIVILAVVPVIAGVLVRLGTPELARLVALISPMDILDATNAILFDTTAGGDVIAEAGLPDQAYFAAAAIITAVAIAILIRRFQRIAA
jgi:ABC-2 type transport system permease protein